MEVFSRKLGEVLGILSSASLEQLSLAIVAYLASILVYSIRLLVAARLSRAAPRLTLRGAVITHLISMLVNNITPAARAGGELARALLASIYGGGNGASTLGVIIFERVTEALGVVLIIACLVVFGGETRTALVILGLVLAAASMLVKRYWRGIVLFAERKLVPRRYVERLGLSAAAGLLDDMMRDRGLVLFGVAAGTAVWVLDALRLYFVAASLGYWIGFEKSLMVSMLYLAAGALAFTPGGLGIVEGGLTAAFVAVGMPAAAAFSATLIERLLSYGLGSLLGAAALMLEGGQRLWRALR